jgi:hypothetical protein
MSRVSYLEVGEKDRAFYEELWSEEFRGELFPSLSLGGRLGMTVHAPIPHLIKLQLLLEQRGVAVHFCPGDSL